MESERHVPTSYEYEQAVREERTLRRFIENAPVAIAMFDRDMCYLTVSRRWMRDYGLDERDIIGLSHYTVFPEIGDAWKAVHQRALAGEVVRAAEDRFVRADGTIQWLRWEVKPWYTDDGAIGGIVMFTEDITDLKSVEEHLQRQNRTLRLLSAANQALIRAETEEILFQRVCDTAVEAGGYRFAWVGYVEDDAEKTVRPVVHAGVEDRYLTEHHFSWDALRPEGQGPIGQAIRTRHPIYADDLQTEPHFAPWRDDALARGYRSSIALPLVAHDDVIGAFVLYRGEQYIFIADELTLLTELADDLAYGIMTLRTRAARRQAEEALRKSEAQYRTILDTAQEGIWIFDRDYHVTYVNQHMAEMLGYPIADIIGRPLFDFIDANLRDEMAIHMERRRHGIKEVYEFCFRRHDGSEIWTLLAGSPLLDEQGRFTGTFAMLTDITDRHYAETYQREFARMTIEAATEGKLIVSTHDEIITLAGPALASWEITRADDLETIRHGIADIVRAAGMTDDRLNDFLLCVSEAATNACKHAHGGHVSLHRLHDAFLALITDHGPGILPINLPKLALQPGYTTSVSMGMGYKAMIAMADKVYLATGRDGTVVGIQMGIRQSPAAPPVFPGLTEDW